MRLSDSGTNCMTLFTMFQGSGDPLNQRLPKNTTRLGAGEDRKHREDRRRLFFPGTWLMLLSRRMLTIPQARKG